MGAFSDVMNQHGVKAEALLKQSNKMEALDDTDNDLYAKRAAKRATAADGGYEKAGIAKPRSGRGISDKHLAAAVAGTPVPRKARAKLARAFNALIKETGKPAVATAVLFGTPNMKKKDAAG